MRHHSLISRSNSVPVPLILRGVRSAALPHFPGYVRDHNLRDRITHRATELMLLVSEYSLLTEHHSLISYNNSVPVPLILRGARSAALRRFPAHP